MRHGTELTDESMVPLRWLVVVVGAGISCLGASFYLVFSVSSFSSQLALGQKIQGERITALENRSDLGRQHYDEIIQRLSKMEGQNELILKEIRKGQ